MGRAIVALALLNVGAGRPDGLWGKLKMVDELLAMAKDQVKFEVQNQKLKFEIKDSKPRGAPSHEQGEDQVTLATFDKAKGATYSWRAMSDPVMGGRSHSSFEVEGSEGHFKGTCAVVPKLKAPGFCKVGTQHSLFSPPPHFANASRFSEGALYLDVETTTPEYEGFMVAFGAANAKHPPGAMHHSPPSFKAGFRVTGTARTIVKVPFSSFSVDWSDFTGRCDTKDPNNGYQHHCCSAERPDVCPAADNLDKISSLEIWAEGVAGDFDINIFSIGAGPLEDHRGPLMI